MRCLILIFACYISLLAMLPCHDSVECNESHAEQVTDHKNHASDNEQCPPFCTCACCGVQIAQLGLPVLTYANQSAETPTSKPSFYTFILPNEIARSIWQPPKIS